MLFGLLLLLLSLMILVHNFIPRKYWRILKAGFKSQPIRGYIPGLGHTLRMIANRNNVHSFLLEVSKEVSDTGNTGVCWFGPIPFFCVADPEDALTVANKCINKSYVYDFALMWIGRRSLFTLNDDAWKHDRKMITPAFNTQVLNSYLPVFNDCSREMIQSFEDKMPGGYIDTFEQLNLFMIDVLAKTILGVDSDLFPRESYGQLIQDLMTKSIKRVYNVLYHIESIFKQSNMYKEMTEQGKIFNSISQNLIDDKKSKTETMNDNKSEGIKFRSFLDLLIEKHREGEISEEQIRAEMNFMVCAAYDTTLSSLTMLLCSLGMYSEAQEKVYRELTAGYMLNDCLTGCLVLVNIGLRIRNVFGDSDRDVEKDDLNNLPYLEAVIKETLRLYSSLPAILRAVTKDTQLKSMMLPEGSQVIIGLYGSQIDKCWGEDRMEFKPERWLNCDNLAKIDSIFAPFSLGRRNCAGKQFAMMLMKTVLIQVIRKFRIVKEVKELGFNYEFVSKPVSGNKISFSLRQNSK